MKIVIKGIPIILLWLQGTFCLLSADLNPQMEEENLKKPLILTPLIETNKIDDALAASEVHFNKFKDKKSYAGYFTVNKSFNSNLFFWFFPAENDFESAPVVLWLQGGPGSSSLIGLFSEHGPFFLSKQELNLRKYARTQTMSMIYIDNPVGSGFSFTDDAGYAQNQTKIGQDLYIALEQFFLMFPKLQKNPFFITGESYAGKYIPAISYTIHKNNPSGKVKINLQGLAIGNGVSDPVNQLQHGEHLYQFGLIDSQTLTQFKFHEAKLAKFIQNKKWITAFQLYYYLLHVDHNNRSYSYFKNVTGYDNFYNLLHPKSIINGQIDSIVEFLQGVEVCKSLHVGNVEFKRENHKVFMNLLEDIMQSVAPLMSELLSHYRVLIYNGQLDIIVPYSLTENYLKKLKFSSADEYKTAKRFKWYVDSDLAGYVKSAGNLTEVLVRNSGHMVPCDQPKWAFDLINKFIRNEPFDLVY